MIKFFKTAALSLILFILMANKTYAESSYVLPYPSSMPGNLSYKIHLIYENISKYWYFGDFGQFDYNLKLSDKYLVEAKTLFEYKQYLLGYKALGKSDRYFINILPNLIKARKNNKNTIQKKTVFNEAVRKHIETLKLMEINTPNVFDWEPEKATSTTLDLKRAIDSSIHLRENNI